MKSKGGATLALQSDGSILASGDNVSGDVYTISAISTLDRIATVRLEALPDPSLPQKGPGRHSSGNFQLAAFRIYSPANDGPDGLTPLPLRPGLGQLRLQGLGRGHRRDHRRDAE